VFEEHVTQIDLGANMEPGAPLPMLIADERHGVLVFRAVSDASNDDRSCVFEFVADIVKFGYPSDESLSSHRLYEKGLKFYSAGEVHDSTWIEELYSQEDQHNTQLRHVIVSFHDSTFECIARKVRFTVVAGDTASVFRHEVTRFLAGGSTR
jgi:hypothetical protein